MKTLTDMIRNLMIGAAMLSLLISCADEDNLIANSAEVAPVPISGELCFSLKLSLNENSGTLRATTGSNNETTRPGVDEADGKKENAVHSVCLFFEDLTSEGNPVNKEPKKWFKIPYPDVLPDNGVVTLKIHPGGAQQLTTGLKKVYIGVNLSNEQAECFANNKAYAVNDDLDYCLLTEKYAPGKGIGLVEKQNGDNTRTDIAMFCTKGQNLTLTDKEENYSIEDPFDLKRNVAKILVTCKVTETNGINYCVLKDGLEDQGWIRQESVRFLINALNRQSFIMQKGMWVQELQQYYYEDPNSKLTDFFYIDNANGIPVPHNLRDHFLHHAIQTLNKQFKFYVKTLPFSKDRLPSVSHAIDNSYYEGLYCPENTFDLSNDEDTKKVLESYKFPWPMITHVSITAKFTPKVLFVEQDLIGSNYLNELPNKNEIEKLIKEAQPDDTYKGIVKIESPSEEISWAILTASLKKNNMFQESQQGYDEAKDGFPEKTYLSVENERGETEFYTYGTAKTIAKALGKWNENDNPKILASFKAMPRGRGYYYTYVDNRKHTDNTNQTNPTYADGQVERNTYYILTIGAFTTPGRTGSEPEYIKVYTNVEKWKDGGQANVELN